MQETTCDSPGTAQTDQLSVEETLPFVIEPQSSHRLEDSSVEESLSLQTKAFSNIHVYCIIVVVIRIGDNRIPYDAVERMDRNNARLVVSVNEEHSFAVVDKVEV